MKVFVVTAIDVSLESFPEVEVLGLCKSMQEGKALAEKDIRSISMDIRTRFDNADIQGSIDTLRESDERSVLYELRSIDDEGIVMNRIFYDISEFEFDMEEMV